MTIRLGDIAPDFTQDSTDGKINFYDYAGDNWVILFSHPKDFTPVCTTELGYMAGLKPEFDKRGVKVLGLSVDGLGDHEKWADDIKQTQGNSLNFPLVADLRASYSKGERKPRSRRGEKERAHGSPTRGGWGTASQE